MLMLLQTLDVWIAHLCSTELATHTIIFKTTHPYTTHLLSPTHLMSKLWQTIVLCLANRNSIKIPYIHIRICPLSIGQADKGKNWWTPSFHRAQPDFSTTAAFLALHKYRDCNTVLPHDIVAIISTGSAWKCSNIKCSRPWHMLTKLLGSLSYSFGAGSSMHVRPKQNKLLRFGNKLLQVYLYLMDSKKLWLEIHEAINSYSVVSHLTITWKVLQDPFKNIKTQISIGPLRKMWPTILRYLRRQ